MSAAGLPEGTAFEGACHGLSGDWPEAHRVAAKVVPAETVTAASDTEVALEGAAGGEPGVVVVAGTGSMALARDLSGRTTRCGGWGYLFGDRGGAFDLVRQALRKALASEEGWGGPTTLRDLFLKATATETVNDALHRFYSADWPHHRVAALAPGVDVAAGHGDQCALEVLRAAGTHLGELAARAVRALPSPGQVASVYRAGGVFRSETVRSAFARTVRSAGLQPARPHHDASVGALLLAYRSRGLTVSVRESQ